MSDSTAPDKVETDNETPLPVVYEDLRQRDVPSDFTIKVGEESFPVHRKTITTQSEYFRAMLEHDTKEKQQESVDVIDVPIVGVRQCIEFMYTGLLDVDAETVEDILKTADMWQLSKVTDVCGKFLEEKLDSGNCVSNLGIATKYSFSELQERAQTIYNENFDTGLPELLRFVKDDFVKFLKTHILGNEVAWDAIINWIKHDSEKRSEFVLELMENLNWDVFPSAKLLERLWDESLTRNCLACRKFLFKKLFLDLKKFKSNLTVENILILKSLSQEFEFVIREIEDALTQFLKINLLLLSNQPRFELIDAEEFVKFFTNDASHGLVLEKSKWKAMMTWIKYDRTREVYLPELMKSIKLYRIPIPFLETVVKNEPLVTDECYQAAIVGSLNEAKRKKTKNLVVVLYSDGNIKAMDIFTKVWKHVAVFPEKLKDPEIFYFNEKLCLINESKLFYLQSNQWIERSSESAMTGDNKQITTLDDFIYAVSTKRLFCYHSLSDSWKKVKFRIEYKDTSTSIYSAAALDGSIYASSPNAIYKFEKNVLAHTCRIKFHTSKFAFGLNQKIYFCQRDGRAGKFDLTSGYLELKNVPALSENQRKPGWNFTQSYIKAAFDLAERPAVVRESKIYLYDELCDNWTFFVDVPNLVTGSKGNVVEMNMVSACSYYE